MHFCACCRWKLLDFAELKRSSISFFQVDEPETAVSRWSRARTRVAKVNDHMLCASMNFCSNLCELLSFSFETYVLNLNLYVI